MKSAPGFTLIELMVVISIIAVLASAGYVTFTKVTANAQDARRKADIDSIAKAYEVKYNSAGKYQALVNTDFASGSVPQDPRGNPYFNVVATDGTGFKACAALSVNPYPMCNTSADYCYCQVSTQGTIASTSLVSGTFSDLPGSPNDSSPVNSSTVLGGSSTAPSCDPNGTLTTGLAGYWKMSEGTGGIAHDSSGNGNNGEIGYCAWTQDSVENLGNALDCNGGGVINVGNSSAYDSSVFTISMWIKLNPAGLHTGGENSNIIMGRENYQISGFRYGISSDGRPVFWTGQSGGNLYNLSNTSISDGNWHNLVTIYNGTAGQMYLDGKSVAGPTNGAYKVPAGHYLFINGGIGGTTNSNSKFDDVRFYNRALSSQEVSNLYNSGQGCIE